MRYLQWWSYEDCRGLKTTGKLRPEIFRTIWAPNARHTWKSVSVFDMPNHACYWVGSGCKSWVWMQEALIVAAPALHIVVLVMMKPSPLATVVGRCCSVGSPHLIRHRGLPWSSHGWRLRAQHRKPEDQRIAFRVHMHVKESRAKSESTSVKVEPYTIVFDTEN